MQANPYRVKTLFLLKNVDIGDSQERESERERQSTQSYIAWSQEVGVGFKGCGKVLEVHVRRSFAALSPTCVQQSLFYLIQLHFVSTMAAEWGDTTVGYLHVTTEKKWKSFLDVTSYIHIGSTCC